jgi:hypothetical protein
MAAGAQATKGAASVAHDDAILRAKGLISRGSQLGVSGDAVSALDVKGQRFVSGQVRGGVVSKSRMGLLAGSGRLTGFAAKMAAGAEARSAAADAAAIAARQKFAVPTLAEALNMTPFERGGLGADEYIASFQTKDAKLGRGVGRFGAAVRGGAQRAVAGAQAGVGYGARGVAKAARGGSMVIRPRPLSEKSLARKFKRIDTSSVEA